MPYTNLWVHLVWSTKNRNPYLRKEIRYKVFNHIRGNAKSKSIYIDIINGFIEHVHILVSLKPDQSASKIAHLLKGESSRWINKNNLCRSNFQWQEEYTAISVSPSNLQRVRKYIENQEDHHRKKSFLEEYKFLMRNIKLPRDSSRGKKDSLKNGDFNPSK